jgi:hypothetical protein
MGRTGQAFPHQRGGNGGMNQESEGAAREPVYSPATGRP